MKKILILEDDSETLEIFTIILSEEGYDVLGLKDDDELDKKILIYCPDLLIIDIRLNGIDGITISQNLKSNDNFKSIPIILTTAGIITWEALGGLCEGFLAKPFDVTELIKTVDNLIRTDNVKT